MNIELHGFELGLYSGRLLGEDLLRDLREAGVNVKGVAVTAVTDDTFDVDCDEDSFLPFVRLIGTNGDDLEAMADEIEKIRPKWDIEIFPPIKFREHKG